MITSESRVPYPLGHSTDEIRRLDMQAKLLDPTTRHLLVDAGVQPGMHVLDIGCGPGAVTLLAARMVGPRGSVTGVDANPAVLDTARDRFTATGMGNVSFVQGDLAEPAVYEKLDTFDAVVGRFALCWVPDPVEVLRRLSGRLRPHGLLAFHDVAFLPPASLPDSPTLQAMWGWIAAALSRMYGEYRMGLRLHSIFVRAGLPGPTMRMDAYMGSGPDWTGYTVMADLVRSLLPRIVEFGIATAEQVDIDTLGDRLRADIAAGNGSVVGWSFATAWARKP
ncbi:MAG TPA: class I SAM-dependent methyltransferase [Mycobacteriales bacterium]|nr:class I SAM-dependent methyltransferase [Mycobacteriales bacterium]